MWVCTAKATMMETSVVSSSMSHYSDLVSSGKTVCFRCEFHFLLAESFLEDYVKVREQTFWAFDG